MRLVRFDTGPGTTPGLGILRDGALHDVSRVLDRLPPMHWPVPPGDALIAALPDLREEIARLASLAEPRAPEGLRLLSPVANPGKVIAAPVNYVAHQAESNADREITQGRETPLIDRLGLFLKSPTSVVGASEGIRLPFPDRRTDHEVELAVVIGREARNLSEEDALGAVAGYTIGLDISVRGTEDRSWRKSFDTFTVLGPALVTPESAGRPDAARLTLAVNGETRQDATTADLVWSTAKLIAVASATYPLYPGDVILTGTPEGVGPLAPGDRLAAEIDDLGRLETTVLT